MKTVVWEPSTGALIAWLLTHRQAMPVDLWTVTLLNGSVLRWSGGDRLVTVNGSTWAPGPGVSRSNIRQSVGVDVDAMAVDLIAGPADLVGGVPILQALRLGAFAGSTWRVDRAFFDDSFVCMGVMPGFSGSLGSINSLTRSKAAIQIVSAADLFNVQVPSAICQASCRATLFDSQCGASRAAYLKTYSTSAASGSPAQTLTFTTADSMSNVAGYFDLGVITITSGTNAGVSRTVRSHTVSGGNRVLSVAAPFPYPVASGVSFTVTAGCNKTAATCLSKFANLNNFRGEPYVPAPETIA